MEINLTKSEKLIAIIAFVAISIFFGMFLQLSRGAKISPQFKTASAIDYTMARPDQAYSEYTLEGRELDHTFEGLPAEQTEAKLDKNKKELIAKKVAESKKKDELKKKQAALAKQEQPQPKLTEPLQSKPLLANDKNKSKKDSQVETQSQNVYSSNNFNNSNNNGEQPTTPDKKDPKSNKKTFVEWRSSLFANPTAENLALFIAAFRKNEITVIEFQVMAQDLVDQSDPKLKALGLMALRSAPSLASLSQLVHLAPTALGPYQDYVVQSINAYLQPQNLQYLNQALLTQDKKLVVKSLTLLSTNLTKFSEGDLTGLVDPRNRREGEVVNFSMSNYRPLLPALVQLGSSQDPELSGLAQPITSLIQTSNNLAQN